MERRWLKPHIRLRAHGTSRSLQSLENILTRWQARAPGGYRDTGRATGDLTQGPAPGLFGIHSQCEHLALGHQWPHAAGKTDRLVKGKRPSVLFSGWVADCLPIESYWDARVVGIRQRRWESRPVDFFQRSAGLQTPVVP